MKFLLEEHKAIKDAIEKRDLVFDDFSFVKRHDNLNIIPPGDEKPFIFHRKRQTTLDANNQWQTETVYYRIVGKTRDAMDGFEEMMVEFQKWLESV